MSSEEDYPEDEYIDDSNDIWSGEKITEEDYTIPEDEELFEEADIVYSIYARSDSAMKNHDIIMNQKVIDSLKKGKIK